jgi:trehalose 6-phosphate phosphatase
MPVPPLPDETSALFFDLDGTLIEIAALPHAVVVPAGLAASLARAASALDGALAILSGRAIAEVDMLIRPAVRCVAGVHGAERRNVAGRVESYLPEGLAPVLAAAAAVVRAHPDLYLEDKPGAVALHFRQAPELEALCIATLTDAVARTPDMEVQRGKMVVEAKPRGASKGQALRAFLAERPFAGRRPWHIGDDRTDESAFETVRSLGGVAIKVGEGATCAMHRLADPAAARAWLDRAVANLHDRMALRR